MSEERDWVDRVVKVGGALGLNQVKLRFRLQRLRREGVLRRIGLSMPQAASVSTLLAIAIALVYVRLTVAAGGAGDFFSLPPRTLFEFGASYGPAVAAGEWWRWLTAIFLHSGVWHIGFNLLALSIIGPHVEELYGRFVTPFLFMLTGAIASIGSYVVSPIGLGVGASGAIMGLVGIAAGWGQRQGTTIGRNLRNDMLKWSAYVFFFGFLIGADNWAHLFGLLSGAAIGYALRPADLRRRAVRPFVVVLGATGIAAAAGTFLFVMTR